ncbi:MAG: ribosomal protein L7/L12 [Arenimonas sp.]
MDFSNSQLSIAAMAAAERGDLIEAVKIVRTDTGLGLKEAKDVVDAYVSGNPAHAAEFEAVHSDMPSEAIEAIAAGNVIEAIKIVREKNRLGLKEAKDFVDAYKDKHPVIATRSNTIVKGEAGLGKALLISFLVAALITAALWITGII